ncbi:MULTISPECIES: TIGR00645 family protein [Rhodomicrobium]|uniref:TIGR00645 family protein n=1 Tax=Rhodomicrobium TaxID=1068 RepID=UPI000B4BCE69|nr:MULTISPECIES: TIGR00645 family protein [Rhodomicrobium]
MSNDTSGKDDRSAPDEQAESLIERAILASRWILIVFYFGLAFALALYAAAFVSKCIKLAGNVFTLSENEVILAMLGLIDACLVASLMVMVMLTGYENYVSRLDRGDASELTWLGKIDTGSLKVKIASSIVAISSIHLLQVFLNAQQYDNQKIMWTTLIHLAFVLSAFSLAVVDRIAVSSKEEAPKKPD